MTKTIVDIERIRDALRVLDCFNALNLAEVELLEGGKPIEISDVLSEWRFIGLSNQCFVELEFWNPESQTRQEANANQLEQPTH